VASIWLLGGNAEHVSVGDCDRAATTQFCSRTSKFLASFCGESSANGFLMRRLTEAPVQASLKSDRNFQGGRAQTGR
jgi:hypothetical protein